MPNAIDPLPLLIQVLREHMDVLKPAGKKQAILSCTCGTWVYPVLATAADLPTGAWVRHRAEAVLAALEPAIRAKVVASGDEGDDPGRGPMTDYWIWSNEHRAWWRSDFHGYTNLLREAGRYTQVQAERIVHQANIAVDDAQFPNEVAIPVLDTYLPLRARRILAEFENEAEYLKDWTPRDE